MEDIKQVCNAQDVKLVVRKEGETDVEFGHQSGSNFGIAIPMPSSIELQNV